MIVSDDKLHTCRTPLWEPGKEIRRLLRLSRFANSTANIERRPSHFIPIATCTGWFRIALSKWVFSYRTSRIRYDESSASPRSANFSTTLFNRLLIRLVALEFLPAESTMILLSNTNFLTSAKARRAT